ncbi:FAD-binding monooxygenase [Nocardia nova SH22a]|uniref:FAD-binding monooxygenase n=1 Tax=Nocardia nova SH22a TaxID=1415166 RepID=W5T8K2_9NOCA|nr:flavin-dependent oxidoreductase [Nocardia nova]AHH15660.1 FAD-binding monooxygenase [Nocardia nova SH22a]
MKILIAGAGIAGLTAAASLHEVGIEATVIDAVTTLRPLGVGINLLPHAVGALSELGFGAALENCAIPTAQMQHLDRFGNRIWSEPRGRAAGHPWPQYSIHRGELQALLLAGVRDRLGAAAVRTGMSLESFVEDAAGVRCRVLDRSTGVVAELSADALIGADGLHSAVRAQLHPGEGRPLWNGIRMWRGVTESAPFLDGRTMILAGSNRAARFVMYPISRAAQQRGRSLVNWVAEVRVHDESAPKPDWNRTGDLNDVLPHYAGWRLAGVDIAGLITASEGILEYPMVDRDPLPRWGTERVNLIGDAAHPMYPIGSNSGSQAILDARALAAELSAGGEPITGLARYEAVRREAVNAIVLANRDMPMDRIMHAVAERAPDGFDSIDEVLSPAELAEVSAAYRRTSAGQPKSAIAGREPA